jgi:hypothetical protein
MDSPVSVKVSAFCVALTQIYGTLEYNSGHIGIRQWGWDSMQATEQQSTRTPANYEFGLVAYFLSRYGISDIDGRVNPPEILGTSTWIGSYALFYDALGQGRDPEKFYHSLKNARDRFDAHIPGSGRIGWRDTDLNRTPARLPAIFDTVLKDAGNLTENEIYGRISELIRNPGIERTNNQPPIEFEVSFPGRRPRGRKPKGSGGATRGRRSARSNIVGKEAEDWVVDVLRRNLGELASSIRHHSIHGETPGYDISYIDNSGTKQAIEVKGSEMSKVSSFDLTDNELDAARELGDNYTVWVVVNVGNNPRYGRIKDPYGLWQSNNLEISPSMWQVQGFKFN